MIIEDFWMLGSPGDLLQTRHNINNQLLDIVIILLKIILSVL